MELNNLTMNDDQNLTIIDNINLIKIIIYLGLYNFNLYLFDEVNCF
jgi:hypothetical protein